MGRQSNQADELGVELEFDAEPLDPALLVAPEEGDEDPLLRESVR